MLPLLAGVQEACSRIGVVTGKRIAAYYRLHMIQLIQSHAHREEQHMFEAIFRITALVKSDGQGQRVFRVTEREAPDNDAEFLSRLATMYQQEVYTTLRTDDDLT